MGEYLLDPMDANYKFPECAYVPSQVTMTAFPQAEYNPDVDKLGVLTPTETASVADGTKARMGFTERLGTQTLLAPSTLRTSVIFITGAALQIVQANSATNITTPTSTATCCGRTRTPDPLSPRNIQ